LLRSAPCPCSAVPDRRNILHVHDIRNDAQHRTKYPTGSEVNDCRTYVRDFLQKIVSGVWGLEFKRISTAGLIQQRGLRGVLSEADAALASGKKPKSAHFVNPSQLHLQNGCNFPRSK